MRTPRIWLVAATVAALGVAGCSSSPRTTFSSGTPQVATAPSVPAASVPSGGSASPSPSATPSATPKPVATLRAGNPSGHASIPSAAKAADVRHPNHIIGHGTASSCTSAAVVKAVAAGGVIIFKCGSKPVTITMKQTAKVINAHPNIVLDGAGLVTLSGGGARRILYLDTCDHAQGWTTSHCQNQAKPTLTVQNLTFTKGNSTGQEQEGGGGGAIFDRGGRLKVVNSRFTNNTCDRTGPDLGGAAIRVLSQYNNEPVYIVDSTFTGGRCSNGGALSSIGVSWDVLDCVMIGNAAIGTGANPAKSGTPGGGSGGAIYNDGNTYTLTVAGTVIENNTANEGGGAIFYVSNDRSGSLKIDHSTLKHNHSGKFQNFPGIDLPWVRTRRRSATQQSNRSGNRSVIGASRLPLRIGSVIGASRLPLRIGSVIGSLAATATHRLSHRSLAATATHRLCQWQLAAIATHRYTSKLRRHGV